MRLRVVGHVARIVERRGVYSFFLVWKPEVKSQLGRPRRRCEDNIKMNLHEVRCVSNDWIKLATDRDILLALLNSVMNLRVP
jgi:hypothetical protein